MTWLRNAERWLSLSELENDLKEALLKIKGDKKLIEDQFYKHLEFVTGGMRGELGPGINRLNTYTIRRAAGGLAQFILEQGEEAKTAWSRYCL